MPALTKQRLSRLFARVVNTPACHKHTGEDIAVCLDCDKVACVKCDPGFCGCRGVRVAEMDAEAVALANEILGIKLNQLNDETIQSAANISADVLLPALRRALQKRVIP